MGVFTYHKKFGLTLFCLNMNIYIIKYLLHPNKKLNSSDLTIIKFSYCTGVDSIFYLVVLQIAQMTSIPKVPTGQRYKLPSSRLYVMYPFIMHRIFCHLLLYPFINFRCFMKCQFKYIFFNSN